MLKNEIIKLGEKMLGKQEFSVEAVTLQLSLVTLLISGIFINAFAYFFISNIFVFIKLCVMYVIFAGLFICLRLKLLALPTLQLLSIVTVLLGLSSFWFETKGLLGSVIFTYLIVIVLGNTLLPTFYHRILLLSTIALILGFSFFELKYPDFVAEPYPSVFAEKIFSIFLLILGVTVCGEIIHYFKSSYEKAHQVLQSQNNTLQKTNQELDQLIYSISHDLRAPIVSIMGLISLHKEIATDDLSKKYIELEEKSLKNLDSFIQELISYSRINRVELQIVPISLVELLTEITEQYAYFHPDRQKVVVEISIDIKDIFYSDKTKLQIALQNIIGNAINYADFSKPNPFCKITATQKGDSMEITISDNGLGIDAQHGHKIFEMFYRANNKVKGSGLGLYIVKEAIEKIQGKIDFESVLHTSTTFYLKLPNLKGMLQITDNE